MFCPAKESLVTGSTITSVLPEVVSPMVTAGESSAKSINSRPFTGRLTIWRSVMTLLTCVRVVSITSEETATSTLSATPPGVNVKSSSAACPTCRITFLVCLPNPVNSTATAYSPAGSAGIAYSPLSELCTVRAKPVEALNIVTLALETLPPEVSTILPDRVAVMAWLRAAGATQMSANKHAKEIATDTQNGWIRFFTLTPRERLLPESRHPNVAGVYQSKPARRAQLSRLSRASAALISRVAAALRRENREIPQRNLQT